jgi:octaprenyl-diphosphate synthase
VVNVFSEAKPHYRQSSPRLRRRAARDAQTADLGPPYSIIGRFFRADAPLTLSDLLAPITDDMRAVDAVIRERLNSDVVLIRTIGEHIIQSGGKRMRPALLLLMARALGYEGQQHHLLAAVVEFIHTSTLLHDDVVDESDLRRGRSTANALFGNAASVLVGDYLYSRSFEMMVEADSMRVMQVLSQATTVIAEGEVLQLLNVHDPDVSLERYMQVVRYKTAKLFEAAAQVGAIAAGASAAHEQAAAAYGRHLGTAFQLIDDALDYSGSAEVLGKNAGDDLREGKPTLPLIHVMQTGTPAQRDLIRRAIETGEADFQAVALAIEATQALEYTRAAAEREASLARAAARQLPPSSLSGILLQFCSFAVERNS